jgi:hypothetical protein
MNFLGLGFNFGAQDKGLADSLKTTTSGLADIGKSVTQIGLSSAKMAFKPPNFGPAIGQAQSLAGDMKLHTTMLEAYGVQAGKVSSAGLSGLNKTSTEMKKLKGLVSSTAFSMNTDLGGVTNSVVALTQAGIDVNKKFMGFKSFKQFQKVIEVTGADATKTAAAMSTLKNQYGMNEKAIGSLMKKNLALGRKMNIGRESMQGFGDSIKFLSDNATKLGDSFDQEAMEKYVLGTTRMQGGLVAAGASAADAAASTRKMNEMLIGGQQGMKALFAGVDKDLAPGVQALTEHFGGVDKAFEMMKDSPDKFAQEMAGAMKSVREVTDDPKAFDRFNTQMTGLFGPGMMKGVDKGSDAMLEAFKKTEKLGDGASAFDDVAKAQHDGRTAAERFQIAQDRLLTKMKKIEGVMSDQTYLKKYKENTDALYKSLNKTAKKGGPLGKMTTMMIEMRTKGIGGALASHSKYGMALAEMSNQMQPVIRALPGLAAAFAALASPVVLVAGAIAGLYFLFKDLEKGENSVVRPWIDKLKKSGPAIKKAVVGVFTEAIGVISKVLKYVVDKIDFTAVGEVLGVVLENAAKLSLTIFAAAFDLGEKLLTGIGNLPWGAIGKKIGYYLAAAFDVALTAVIKVVKKIPAILIKAVTVAVKAVIGLLSGIEEYLVKKFPKAAKPIMFVFFILKSLVKIIGVALKLAVKIVVGVFKVGWAIIKGAIQAVVWVVEKVIGAVKAVGEAASFVAGKVKGFFGGIASVASGALSSMGGVLGGIGDAVGGLFSSTEKKAKVHKKSMAQIAQEQMAAIQLKIDKGKADQIGSLKELKNASSSQVRKLAQDMLDSGQKVVTVEGKIIEAAKSVTQYVGKGTGEVKKMVYEANQLRFANIQLDPFIEARAEFDKMNKAQKDLLKNENYSSEKFEEGWQNRKARLKEFQDQYGVSMGAVSNADKYISSQLAINKKMFSEVTGASKGYRASLMANQDQLAKNAGETFLLISKQLESKKISKEQANEQFAALEQSVEASRALALEVKPILQGSFNELMSGIKKGSGEAQVQASRVSQVWMANYKANTDDILASIPEASKEARSEIRGVFDELAETQRKQMKMILSDEKLSGKEREKQVKALNVKFIKAQNELTATLKKQNGALVSGAVEDTLVAVKKIKTGFNVMTEETKTKTAEAAGEIQKTMGVSADQAAKMVGTISNLKPAKFKKNMRIIKLEFKSFLQSVTDEAKSMMDKGAEYINTFWKTAEEGWRTQTSLVDKWATDSKNHIRRYWTDVISEAGTAAWAFVGLVGRVIGSLKSMSSKFNLLDIMAGPQQIRSWAASVTSALATALRGGAAVEALTMASYDKAMAMYSRGTATAEGGESGGSPSSSKSSRQGALNMQRNINNPQWSREGPLMSELTDINKNLKNLQEVIASQGGKGSFPKVKD